MKKQKYPPGWNEERVRQVIAHYDDQTEEQQAAEIEATRTAEGQTMMSVPTELVPKITWLFAQHQARQPGPRPRKRKSPRQATKKGRRTMAHKAAG
jgi:hypothetical protein